MHLTSDIQYEHLNTFSSFCLAHECVTLEDLNNSLAQVLNTTLSIWVYDKKCWSEFSSSMHNDSSITLSLSMPLTKPIYQSVMSVPAIIIPINHHTVTVLQPAPDLAELELAWAAIIRSQVEKIIQQHELYIQEQDRDNAIASIAHDLKNPLTTIRGSTELILRHAKKEVRTERELNRLQTIISQCDRMRDFLSALVDVSRLHAGDLALVKYPLDIVKLIERTIHALNTSYALPRVRFVSSEHAFMITGDQIWLERAVENLLDNALKYSPPSENILVSINRIADSVLISIKDKGIGISSSDLERIFKRFARGSNSYTMSSGSGLGLYTVKTVVEAHNGSIEVHSEGVGQGSMFQVCLPLLP